MHMWALFLVLSLAVPPLTSEQQAVLSTAVDDSPRLMEPALDPLLENVLLWKDGNEAGARVPDYDSLLNDPSAARGELFLIEGRFAGRARRVDLPEVNPWFGDALTEWVLIVRDQPEEVAVVYFLDPDGTLKPPQAGEKVRVAARFFKVWADRDQDGNSARYLTFVARSAVVAGVMRTAPGKPILPMLLLILALSLFYLVIRRMSNPVRPATSRRRPTPPPTDDGMLSDPAEALKRMAERHDAN